MNEYFYSTNTTQKKLIMEEIECNILKKLHLISE